jgi:hypothetical protein
MKKEENLINVFTGTDQTATLLKERLAEIGVDSLIKNDSDNAFFLVTPAMVDLFIKESDYDTALPLLNEFKNL